MPGSKRSVVDEAKDLKPLSVRLFRCTRTSLPRRSPGTLREPPDRGTDHPKPARRRRHAPFGAVGQR
jgi:hypothetical protein